MNQRLFKQVLKMFELDLRLKIEKFDRDEKANGTEETQRSYGEFSGSALLRLAGRLMADGATDPETVLLAAFALVGAVYFDLADCDANIDFPDKDVFTIERKEDGTWHFTTGMYPN